MEFWGVEVKSGEPLNVSPGDGMVLHLSQASLGELKKERGKESVCLFVTVDDKKLVLGTLFTEKLPQQQFDLVFDRDFEISHNWKNGSVYFYGYKASNPFEEEDLPGGESDDSDSEELPINIANNGKPESNSKQDKPVEAGKPAVASKKESGSGKPKVTISEPKKDLKPEEDDESSDDDMTDDDDEDDSEDSDGLPKSDDSDESDSDEETPKKVEPSKKRPAESPTKTPSNKKAKAAQQKPDGKKGEPHVATPHPAKLAGKAAPAPSKPNQQTPKSAGTHSCKSCNRSFGSAQALDSHTKAKHGN
ncbi:histone deacetylase HDT1-like isoform X2 [Andrographis paniculata]|uniref:histone deacetylase HDT1-like isoform X2 n=1 Tax=Andrographis paniculata TaxID=175694 RepID=UPI0021E8C250|nr:histone deacetylase HDT1-like isoform X2 [Andrographis paniculata]